MHYKADIAKDYVRGKRIEKDEGDVEHNEAADKRDTYVITDNNDGCRQCGMKKSKICQVKFVMEKILKDNLL